jgi:hypothetical protein
MSEQLVTYQHLFLGFFCLPLPTGLFNYLFSIFDASLILKLDSKNIICFVTTSGNITLKCPSYHMSTVLRSSCKSLAILHSGFVENFTQYSPPQQYSALCGLGGLDLDFDTLPRHKCDRKRSTPCCARQKSICQLTCGFMPSGRGQKFDLVGWANFAAELGLVHQCKQARLSRVAQGAERR